MAGVTRRGPLGLFFVAAGVLHFVKTGWYERIVPPWLPAHRALVYASGVFPANIHMALHPDDYVVPGGATALYARLPFQLVFIVWVRTAMRR